mgnify:FL=1
MTTTPKEYDFGPPTERILEISGRVARHVNRARQIAATSEFPDYRHGAVLVRGGAVINVSANKDNFCSFGSRFRNEQNGVATVHAELGCILGIDKSKTEGTTLYVVRVGKAGDLKLSKPCPMCYAALKYAGIKKVIFSLNSHTCGSYKIK